jgi:rubrerythrin
MVKKYKLLTKDERPSITIDESAKESFKEIIGWDEDEFKKRTVEIIPYYIYVCKKCKSQMEEANMGKKCPECGEWTYYKDCKKECAILGADES